jgi:hypothetical protein
LDIGANVIQRLSGLSWPSFFNAPCVEAETLLTHLVELVWYRVPSEGKWEQILRVWENSELLWAKEILGNVRRRLLVQTQLTVPSKRYPLLGESSVDKLRHQSDFAELWLLELYGRRQGVRATVERLTPNVSGDSHERRVLTDFGNADKFFSADNEEAQSVQLARRRRLSACCLPPSGRNSQGGQLAMPVSPVSPPGCVLEAGEPHRRKAASRGASRCGE